ncbi:thioredoxin domain-containing protein [Brevibacterium sp. 50QC2O2]|jgi:mycoredoxin|uniref:glutaredoxin domain-containing protein n=1 Tax=unclassified Brevibacterium TaxID=2614124 RepID=UPI00211BE8E1|nr:MULTISPECIES: glutaredoxin domain-containing protein [unclassified Brevibacterium]MCQ9369515.1 thioredoxin domain-containing protein [Brevibacterium sp. 91QC2O2]MCQ9389848.1 thioredoxin domain-containing protein [Brevibacterium sp. 50QC2O2]
MSTEVEEFLPEAGKVTMFTTSWCGYCKRLKPQLAQAGIEINEVNIEDIANGAKVVETANGGNQTVPTLLYIDGTTQTNPSAAQVKEKLAALA